MARLEIYLATLAGRVLPKSALVQAANYARNQWDALRCCARDGRLTIDNNTSKRTLRHRLEEWHAPRRPPNATDADAPLANRPCR